MQNASHLCIFKIFHIYRICAEYLNETWAFIITGLRTCIILIVFICLRKIWNSKRDDERCRNIHISGKYNPFVHPRNRTFNGVKGRPKATLSEWPRLFRGYESHEIHLLLFTVSSNRHLPLFYIARSILQPSLNLTALLPSPCFRTFLSRISFRELSFVLSRRFFSRSHPPLRHRPPDL